MAPQLTYIDASGETRLKSWALPVVVAGICFPIAIAFLLGGSGVGLAVTALVAVSIVIVAARSRPYRAMEVAAAGDARGGVLVVAARELDEAAAERIRRLAEPTASVRIVVPAPSSRLSRWLSAEDSARDQAQGRLARAAGVLAATGLDVSGSVGDSDPVQAVEDELRSFAADEVVVLPAEGSESRVEELRGRLALPLTTVGKE